MLSVNRLLNNLVEPSTSDNYDHIKKQMEADLKKTEAEREAEYELYKKEMSDLSRKLQETEKKRAIESAIVEVSENINKTHEEQNKNLNSIMNELIAENESLREQLKSDLDKTKVILELSEKNKLLNEQLEKFMGLYDKLEQTHKLEQTGEEEKKQRLDRRSMGTLSHKLELSHKLIKKKKKLDRRSMGTLSHTRIKKKKKLERSSMGTLSHKPIHSDKLGKTKWRS